MSALYLQSFAMATPVSCCAIDLSTLIFIALVLQVLSDEACFCTVLANSSLLCKMDSHDAFSFAKDGK